jgi:glycosyltransferase involved in cell wall biosynthesis
MHDRTTHIHRCIYDSPAEQGYPMTAISLICTVFNEGANIRALMDSIVAQTRLPDEIVIVDAGSRDDTVAILQSYADRLPVRVIIEPGCNISRGRNRAIHEAQGAIIAVTDAGVRLAPQWLEAITDPLRENTAVQVVAGWFEADPRTTYEAAMSATVLPSLESVAPETFLPSSRSVAFRKAVWLAVGGYPGWLDYCEDLIFDLRLFKVAAPFTFAPRAVAHFRPRGSLRSFYKQYYLYARGDGKADLWRKRHLARYITYLVLIPAIFLLGVWLHPSFFLLYLVGGAVYMASAYRRLPAMLQRLPNVRPFDALYAAAMIPIIRVVGDIAKMIGYPVGIGWRQRTNPPDWRRGL